MGLPTWEEAAEDEFWQRVPNDLHEEEVRSYLGHNGDAIDERVGGLISVARKLLDSNFPGPSIVASVTALEVMIQYFCVRPIVEGGFLSELIAHEATRRITAGRSSDQRSLLVHILRPWGIELEKTVLEGGKPLWGEFQSVVVKTRDAFVHRGDDVPVEIAALGLNCANEFRSKIVEAIGKRLGFTPDKTGVWSQVIHDSIGPGHLGGKACYVRSNPFS